MFEKLTLSLFFGTEASLFQDPSSFFITYFVFPEYEHVQLHCQKREKVLESSSELETNSSVLTYSTYVAH